MYDFDKDYWEEHWRNAKGGRGAARTLAPNPHLVQEVSGLVPGTALDAGCGEGAEATWLASRGWDVTAVDISGEALERAAARAAPVLEGMRAGAGAAGRVRWVEADLSGWEPGSQFDLVTTHYAHPAMPQLAFYDRISAWVAPGGTLLLVGHRHAADTEPNAHHPPAAASVAAADVAARLDERTWEVVTAEERRREVAFPDGRTVPLHDVVVRATRRP